MEVICCVNLVICFQLKSYCAVPTLPRLTVAFVQRPNFTTNYLTSATHDTDAEHPTVGNNWRLYKDFSHLIHSPKMNLAYKNTLHSLCKLKSLW